MQVLALRPVDSGPVGVWRDPQWRRITSPGQRDFLKMRRVTSRHACAVPEAGVLAMPGAQEHRNQVPHSDQGAASFHVDWMRPRPGRICLRPAPARQAAWRHAVAGLALALGALVPLTPTSAQAQQNPLAGAAPPAGRVVPETFAPQPQRARPLIDIGRFAPLQPPAGAEGIEIEPGEVLFVGDPAPLPTETVRLRDELLARASRRPRATVADLYRFANALERAHAEAGFVLVRVVIPPQRIAPGAPVTISIVDGRIESVDVNGLDEVIRAPVAATLAPLVGRASLRREDIEHALLLAGDLGGLTLRSTFAPGETPGGTRIVLDGAFRRVTGSAGFNHLASDAVGGWAATASVAANSAFGGGEQVYVAYQGAPDRALQDNAHMHIAAVGAVLPIGTAGATVSPELVWARIMPITLAGVPETENGMVRASLRVARPWVRSVDATVIVQATVDAISQRVTATGFDRALFSDAYAAARLSLEGQTLLSAGTTLSGALRLSQGLGGIRSAFHVDDAVPGTRVGASSDFSRVNANLALGTSVGRMTVSLASRAQSSFGKPLFGSEQLTLDGTDALSGLSPGRYAVDEGATLRSELGTMFGFPGIAVAPYALAALGWGRVHQPTAVEAPTLRAAALGVGVRLRIFGAPSPGRSALLVLETAHAQLAGLVTQRLARVNVALTWNF